MSYKKTQPNLFKDFWITAGIFSNHYLLERLPLAGPKIWPTDEEVLTLHKAVRELHEKNIVGLRKGNEANTERRFIDKVFNELGFGYLNRDKIPEADRSQFPDYFLYSTNEEADKAFELSSQKKYKFAISIAEAKRWDHNLDQPSSGKGKAPRGTYPHQQIRDYLSESEHIKWGILTNGKEWRLYLKEGRSSKFFEIDLEDCLEDLQKFKYFYILFRPAAFTKDSSARCFLDYIFEESLRFQEDVEKDLREKVFKCVEWLGHGFLSRDENRLSKKDLDSIYHHSLILLYRILFVLNAEARDLLPTNPLTKYYKHYGIQRIIDRVRQEKGEFLSSKTVLYDDILALFHLINGSNEKLNKDMNIPRYNGGLFDPERYKFLEEKKVGDDVLSEVIYELSFRTENGDVHSIDYKGLGERHLGTVYEGLLEHKFSFDNGKVVLKNDKGERKATGAYYTPDYIVKYIVENTLGPLIKEIDKKTMPPLQRGERDGVRGNKDDSFAREVLNLNICDPAMGSGHFLVESVQYLADEIAYHPTTELKTQKGETEDEINYWKRKVVESCIYGVDIKELAVELAKLSLWLKTVDKSQPLNFLDHHLRCGNSLIGARINDLNYLPMAKGKQKKIEEQDEQLVLFDKFRFKEDITTVIKGFHSIEEMPTEKLSDIKAKEKTFHKLTEELVRYREIADLWTSLFFGNNLEEKEQVFEDLLKDQFKYQRDIFGQDVEVIEKKKPKTGMMTNRIYNFIVNILQSPDGKSQILKLSSLLEKSESISKEKNFFHWELEFPEVFFNEDGSPKENPGFDCVIGNPPYVNIMLIEDEDLNYLLKTFNTARRRFDLFILFGEQAINLLKGKGYHSFIVPDKILSETYATDFRKLVLAKHKISSIFDVSGIKVFPDSAVKPIVYVVKNEEPTTFDITVKMPIGEGLTNIKSWRIPQQDFLSVPEHRIRLDWASNIKTIIEKIKNLSFSASRIIYASWGAQPGEADKFFFYGKAPNCKNNSQKCKAKECPLKRGLCKPLIKGGSIDRYSIYYDDAHILYDVTKLHRPAFPELFENEKIVVREVSGEKGLISAYDAENYYTDHSLINCIPKYCLERLDERTSKDRGIKFVDSYRPAKDAENKVYNRDTIIYIEDLSDSKNYKLKFIVALINSALMGFYYQKYVSGELNVFPEHIRKLPIPHISFTTPEKERKELFREAVKLYKVSKHEDIMKWAEYELALGRNDTVHDFLTYLAGQMIELNKKKNEEIKDFLKWLEREIGAEIDALTNKTAIKEYHEYSVDHFLDVLKKNRNKIFLNPSDRRKQELLEKHFTKSMETLHPLKEKIKTTDKLIDQTVYKLYGLTEEEIEIVKRQR